MPWCLMGGEARDAADHPAEASRPGEQDSPPTPSVKSADGADITVLGHPPTRPGLLPAAPPDSPRLQPLPAQTVPRREAGAPSGSRTHVTTVLCVRAQLCPSLCDPMDRMEPARLLCPRNSPGKNPEVGKPSTSPGDLPDPGIEFASPELAGRFFTMELPGNWIAVYSPLSPRKQGQ